MLYYNAILHLQVICAKKVHRVLHYNMPAPLLSVIQDMYYRDEYVLKDGDKTARVHPTRGVKQGCPLSPLLFSLFFFLVGVVTRSSARA